MERTVYAKSGSGGVRDSTKRSGSGSVPLPGNLVLSSSELAHICHLPLIGVAMDSAHVRVAPTHALGGAGSILARLEDQKQTAVQIAQADRRQHMWLEGPTGSGKSTVLLNLALQDIK